MLFLQTFLLLVISSLVAFGQHTFSSGSSTYTLIEQPKTWRAAKSYAEGQGGQLLEIDSATEMEVVQNALESYFAGMSSAQRTAFLDATRAPDGGGAAYLWLGGSDATSEGVWRWVSTDQQFWSGEYYNGNSVGGAYHNWGTVEGFVQEPDNNNNQDALALGLETWPWVGLDLGFELGSAYQWNDIDLNSNQLYFIIEKDLGNPGIEPPASIAGLQVNYTTSSDVITSVPYQDYFGSDGIVRAGFSGSILERFPYTYANGVITYPSWDEEVRLSFESSTSGTWELWELEGGGYSLDDSGTFTVVSSSLVEKTDWQRTEALDSPLSNDYWQVWRRSVDALAYDDGELSFIFAAGGDSDPETEIQYGRTLPMDENWQVVLEDMYAAPGLSGFHVELELDIADPEFECELYFADYGYGNGREFGVFLGQQLPSGDWEYAQAYITANEDTRISSGGNVRIVHIASSRELIFEYQPDGASEWSELARLNLESGSFQGENTYGSLTGGILSATGPRMTVEIEAEVQPGVATQIADLEIGGIEIGSYTPPATWELYDDFSGSTPDEQKWETWYFPGGQAPLISDGELKLQNGGGSGRKDPTFVNTLQSAGLDVSSATYHSGVAFTDPSIIGVEADLYLPAGVAAESGVTIDMFEQVSSQEIRNAGVELGYWGGSQAELWFAKSAYSSGNKTSVVDKTQYVTLGETYRVRILREDGSIKLYADDVLVQTHDSEGELLAFFIVAFNDVGQPMYATVDNVRVLRSALNTVESYGEVALLEGDSGYYAGDSALIYEGSQLSASSYAGYVVVGVDLYNGNYRLIRTNGSSYYAANFSLTGTNTSKWSTVTNLEAEELNLQQDLDGDGYVGIAPPASLVGKAYQFSIGGDDVLSVPKQVEFDSTTRNEGFAGSLIDANRPYTYANGVIDFPEDGEVRLSFESSTSGTFEYWEYDDGNYSLDVEGTFNEVTPSLVLKTDWQRTEALDSPLSDQYWNVWRRSVDALAYDDGELSFIFAAGGDSDPETEIQYGRTLPMDENWQVVLEDMYAAPGLSGFNVELELEIDDPEFECELYFVDYGYGNGREFGVFLEQQLPSGDWEEAQAYITANEDTRISSGGNVRIVHIASSRELIFEYQPDGASEWSELARLNLESGSFQGENAYGSLTGGILSATGPRMTVEIEAEVQPGVATQIADLEIAGIEIGSYTPPAASITGKGYRITYTDGDLTSVPVDAIFAADSFNYGFSGNLIGSYNYSYEDGVLIWDEEEQVVFNFSSASGGTFQQGYIDEFDGFYVESRGTFKESNIKLSLQTNWPRTETMNKALSSKYWRIETEHSADRVAYDDGELNFIFADDSGSSDESESSGQSHREIELLYAGALPLSEDWQIVVDDTYVSYSVQEFAMGYSLAQEGVFDCEFGFSEYEGVREVYFYTDGGDEDSYNYAYVSSIDDPRIQNGISFRIRHDASSRELIYAYQPDGADDWTELARINLGSGAVSGSKVDGSGLTGPLPSRDQHLFFMVDMDNYATDYQATQIGDLEIGGIQISKGDWKSLLKVSVSLAKGIPFGDGDEAIVTVDGAAYPVTLKRGKGSVSIAMPKGSSYTVSASLDALTSGDPRSVLMNKAATVSLVLDGDSDEDGLPDSQEARYKGDRNNPDTDGDGILDGAEVNTYRTRVDVADTDKDGLSDYDEINSYSTNALKADSDGDRMSDYAEIEAGTDPTDKSEYPAYLKVQVSLAKGISADGDATVLIDGVSQTVSLVRGKGTLQVAMPKGSSYTVSASLDALTSGDPRSVLMNKAATVSLVLDGDSDEDGLPDSQEARYKGDPNNPDTDGDGILDGAEVNTYRTRVDVADTDKDGLSDYDEINSYSTNALKADSDGDRMSDYAEIEAGTDPTDKSEYPAYLKVQVSLAKGISADGDATVLIDGVSQTVSLVRGKGTLQVAMPTGSSYTVSASLDALTSGDPRSVLMNKAATVSLVLDGDSDEDGLPDSQEARYKGDRNNPDTDGDGILDGAEVNTYRTRVDVADTDKDGLSDYDEINSYSTNALKADSDGDRMSDYAEIEAGTDPTDKSEYPAYLKVQVSLAKGISADGDATVLIDGVSQTVSLVRGKGTLQVAMPKGSSYTVSASLDALTSGDPRSVLMNKAATVSLVLDGDSDEDGLPDSQEARYKGDRNNPDTDGDGILDGAEVNTYRTRVDVADTDKDGLSDYDEINSYSTNALKADSDGDRMSDYAEIEAGTDPTDKSEYPAYLKVQVSLAKGISADGDATVLIDGVSQTVSLVRGKGTLQVAMPTGSSYTVSASLDALTSGDPRSVLMNKAATVSLVLDGDSDEDGLPDSQEARYKGDRNNPDTDGDGILDGAEVNTYRTRVDVADTDKDGLSDYDEINSYSTNALKADSDGDRMSDYAEIEAGTDPTDKSEYPAYLKVQVSLAKGISADGDATVLIDGVSETVSLVRGKGTVKVAMPTGSTYTVSASMGALTSGDPRSVLMNKAATVSLVLDGDSDGDGLPDSQEARYKGDPNDPDTDDDGILDGAEVNTYGTRVDVADTDKDGFTDKQELDLNTNPLSSKDKPSAYIERPVVVDWLLRYEAEDGYINEDWSTEQLASFLSAAAGDRQDAASIYLKYSLDGSNVKWIVRHEAEDIDVTSLMRPMKVSKPAQLDAVVMSPEAADGSYYGAELFSLGISAGKTKSLSLVVGGESTFIQLGPNISGLDLDLAVESDYQVLGLMKDPQLSDGPILIEGILKLGDEVANVLGQVIGPVATSDTASTFN